jgi:hypothetical protein
VGDRSQLIPVFGRARILFAAICAIGSIGGVIAALGYELKLTLAAPAVREWPSSFAMVRAEGGEYGTVAIDGSRIRVEKWNGAPGNSPVMSWTADMGKPRTIWTADPIEGWAAWSAGSVIHIVTEPSERDKAPGAKTIDMGGRVPSLITALPGNGLAVVFSGAVLQRWDITSMSLAVEQKIALSGADQTIFDGEWMGVWRPRRNEVVTYAISRSGGWSKRDSRQIPPGSRPVMNAHGGVAAIIRNTVVKDGVAYYAPGPVRSAVLRRFGGILVTGDFEGVYLVHSDRPPERLTGAEPKSQLTLTGGALVVSGKGSSIYAVRGAEIFTNRGRTLVYAAGALFAALVIYTLALFWRLAGKHLKRFGCSLPAAFGAQFARRSTPPPPELIAALRDRRAVLWAGSGLSAQSGHPAWSELLERLQKTAAIESWFEKDTLRKLDSARRSGDDKMLEEIVRGMSNRRPRLIEFITNLFGLPAQLSKSHYALYRMPFRACVTTNYDNLLERLGPDWNARVYTARSPGIAKAVESSTFFLLKLFGDLRDPETILLCSAELYDTLAELPVLGETLGVLFKENSFFFVGVSPERLLADLRNLDFPGSSEVRHWAVSGVSGSKWARAARDLEDEFGVKVIPFPSDQFDLELPLWLDTMSQHFAVTQVPTEPTDPWYVERRAS